jgi:hypothetical protein
MKRYFFDIVTRDRSELDYKGRVCSTMKEAYDAAELIALDLEVRFEDEMIGSAVTVSSVEGRKLFSIPVALTAFDLQHNPRHGRDFGHVLMFPASGSSGR